MVPDASGAARVGENTVATKANNLSSQQDGVTGLKALGVREMTYKLIFVASSIQVMNQNLPSSSSSSDRKRFMNIIPYFIDHMTTEGENNTATMNNMAGHGQEGHGNNSSNYLFTEADMIMIQRIYQTPNLYSRLTESVCPSVFGHLEVKRGILLMLLGGVHKRTKEGIPLRGDINVCIVGDPSCAKSQFLKYVHGFLPRTVYTSGNKLS